MTGEGDALRIKTILKEMVVTGERSDGSRPPLSSLLSLSFCCPVQARRNSRLVRSFGRSLGRLRPGHKAASFRKKKFNIEKQRGYEVTVTLSLRHTFLPLLPLLDSLLSTRMPLTTSCRSSSIRCCLFSIESNLLAHSKLPNVDSFSSVSSAVSGSHNASDR